MKYLYVILCCFSIAVNAQDIKYIDEDMSTIDSLTLINKCKRHMFKCLKYDTDTLIINKLLYKFEFGKLEDKTLKELRFTLNNNSLTSLPNDSYLIIRYYDSLRPYEQLLKNHSKHSEKRQKIYFDSSKTRFYYRSGHKFNKKIYERNRNKFIKTRNKCIKKYETKFNARVFHVIKHDSNIAQDYENFNWLKDSGIFQNTFFSILYNYYTVIIKPDGEFLLIGAHFSDKKINKLLTITDWSIFKDEWEKSINNYPMNGIGLFEDESDKQHVKHCF